jgi:hypothetical protein
LVLGKNQEADGAGGSWGLGKTSFFRLGIGIVIYYTRVEIENGYEERLIASLIESPKQKNRLLPTNGRELLGGVNIQTLIIAKVTLYIR